jgi:hypothetical protein
MFSIRFGARAIRAGFASRCSSKTMLFLAAPAPQHCVTAAHMNVVVPNLQEYTNDQFFPVAFTLNFAIIFNPYVAAQICKNIYA